MDFEDASDSSSEVLAHGWTINTKYYTADVSVWVAHLHDDFSIVTLPMYNRLAALVMVFDLSDLSSLVVLQNWIADTDIRRFEILLCIGNKVDLVPGHSIHAEYRRRLHRLGEESNDPHPGFSEFGISETEGSSLLRDEEPSGEIRRSCLEWCSQHNIEYIEACASNADFDKCLSVDGDSQGIERLYGALTAYMWPGMILKSGNRKTEPSVPEKPELSEEESDYEFEYEILSGGSAEPWDDTTEEDWVSANGPTACRNTPDNGIAGCNVGDPQTSTSSPCKDENASKVNESDNGKNKDEEVFEDGSVEYEDLEQLMCEIGNMRDNLRLMPDFQRREMAAKLAMKVATMFGDGSDDDVS